MRLRQATPREVHALWKNTVKVYNEVGTLTDPVARKLLAHYEQAIHTIARDMNKWWAEQGGKSQFELDRQRSLLLSIDEGLKRIEELESKAIFELQTNASRIAERASLSFYERLNETGKLFDRYSDPASANIAEIVARGDKLLFKRHQTSAERYAGRIGDSIRDQLTQTRLKNLSIREAANEINDAIPGAFKSGYSQTMRLVRTETMHAYNTFQQETLEDLGSREDGWMLRWDAALDIACEWCRQLDGVIVDTIAGKVFVASVNGVVRSAPYAPLHPNCRCSSSAWRIEWGRISALALQEKARALAA